MALVEINWNPDRRFIRQFTLLFVLFFGIVGALQYARHGSPRLAVVIWTVAGTLGIVGFFVPSLMRLVYLGWMLAVFPIGWTVSHLLLIAIFYLVVTPVGIIMRCCGRDPVHRRFDPAAESYWIPRPPQQGTGRYFRQF